MAMTPRDSFKFFWSFGKSKVGVTLLAIFIIISVYVVFTYSPEYSRLIWNNPAAWEEYPKSVPPAWTSYFASKTPLETVFLSTDRPRVETMGTDRIYSWSLRYNYLADDLPTFVLLRIEQLKYNRAPPII
ncbi:MAG: hypothetical protein N3H84_03375, partial [Candidatus Caldarchaeum sp.]|nr:hypothetical protein [Candidatus Caldarchaeum sp.]